MKKWLGLFLLVILSTLFGFALFVLANTLFFGSIFSIDGKHTYTLDEIGQAINSPIPTDATDIVYSSETRYGYFIKLSFKAPPKSALTFAEHICGEMLYQGYDPFIATDSSSSKPDYFLIKYVGYAYFSHSNTSQAIYGNRCQLNKPRLFNPIQVSVDQTDPNQYQIRFELLESSCSMGLTCSGYGIETSAHRPLPRNSPVPLIVYGFEDKRDMFELNGDELCVETNPGLFSAWDKPPFNLEDMKGASFELFVDNTSKGQATISEQGRLTVDYATGKFVGIHEAPEYCFQVDAAKGTHQMAIDVKTVAGKSFHYEWNFLVQ